MRNENEIFLMPRSFLQRNGKQFETKGNTCKRNCYMNKNIKYRNIKEIYYYMIENVEYERMKKLNNEIRRNKINYCIVNSINILTLHFSFNSGSSPYKQL